MLILSSQDLLFSALSKRVLCNAHLAFLRATSKCNKNKLLLLIKIFCLHTYVWCLDSPGWHHFAAVLNAALMDYSTNASTENARQTLILWDCFQVTICSFSAPKQLY